MKKLMHQDSLRFFSLLSSYKDKVSKDLIAKMFENTYW